MTLPERATRLRGGLLLAMVDVLLVATCFAVVLLIPYDGAVPARAWAGYREFLPRTAALYVGIHAVCGLYHQVWRYAGIEEARRILAGGTIALVAVTGLAELHGQMHPKVAVSGAVLTTMLVGITRFQARLLGFRRRAVTSGAGVVVLGANETGARLIRQMRESPQLGLRPVAVLDDHARDHGREVGTVPVAGRICDLPAVARRFAADQAVLAVPDPPRALLRQVSDLAEQAGLALRVLPERPRIEDGPFALPDLRNVSIEDLLGRGQVATDLAAVAALVSGRRVLVTGGGGSIGSEIVRQVARLQPVSLVVLDHDETHLHDTMATLGIVPAVAPVSALCDIRDGERVAAVFAQHRPEVVFHAAAHKHVPILEEHANEALRTNVLGTANVVEAADRVGCRSFVLISTDKAVRPRSVMGASKRMAEHLVVTAALRNGRPWCAVRFGNVLGSRGSVVPTFARQIAKGGPVTVTDPRMTRYFMSIPEAVALVLQAAALSEGADLFMLDMGEPVRIMDLARRMIRLAGQRIGEDVELRVTGLRPGEKLHEELSTPEELAAPTSHGSIVRLQPQPLPSDELRDSVRRLVDAGRRGADQEVARGLLEAASRSGRRTDAAPLNLTMPAPRQHRATEDLVTDDVATGGKPWRHSTT